MSPIALDVAFALIMTYANVIRSGLVKAVPSSPAGLSTIALVGASSARSVSHGAVRETARENIRKSTVRGNERTLVGKLYQRSFRPLIERLQRPVT